jgi:hypothetical protein
MSDNDTLFGMLVDAHGWHIGGCTCLAYWWMHMFGIIGRCTCWHIGRCTCWHMVDTFHGLYILAHC